MKKLKPLSYFIATALVGSIALAQSDKPLTQADLLKQIESLTPGKTPGASNPALAPTAGSLPSPAASPATNPLFNQTTAGGAAATPPGATPGPTDPKSKGPTVITALEATFSQKTNVAVFLQNVVVKDPEFNVVCDKLTALLRHDDKTAPLPPGATPMPATATPSATPGKGSSRRAAATPVASPKPGDPALPKKGGLKEAWAEMTDANGNGQGRRVVITQDKTEADGTITHSIGLSDSAHYDAITGDIILWGMPDVTQGNNRCIATDPKTWMMLNRDGRMFAHGPHKTIIIDNDKQDNQKP